MPQTVDNLDEMKCEVFLAILWKGFMSVGVDEGDFVLGGVEADVLA